MKIIANIYNLKLKLVNNEEGNIVPTYPNLFVLPDLDP